MKELAFYDLKLKKRFNSSKYEIVPKMVKGKIRKFAVHTKSDGRQCWRILPTYYA